MAASLILVACIYVFGGITVAVIDNYRFWKHTNSQVNQLEKTVQIYDFINNTLAASDASRIIVFKSHNGGGLPSLTTHFKVSAFFGTNLHRDTKKNYQHLSVDEDYTRMLLDVIKGDPKFLIVKDMKECLLKRIYHMEGVKKAIIMPLVVTPTGFFYMSVASHESETPEGLIKLFMNDNIVKFEILQSHLAAILTEETSSLSTFKRLVKVFSIKNILRKKAKEKRNENN